MDWARRCGLRGGGSLFALARVRGAEQCGVSSASSADLLPAGRGGVGLERLRRWRSPFSSAASALLAALSKLRSAWRRGGDDGRVGGC
jgi:hypothetical protein